MNKKDLPAMYSTAFWCLFVVLLFLLLLLLLLLLFYCVTTVTPFIERSEGWSATVTSIRVSANRHNAN